MNGNGNGMFENLNIVFLLSLWSLCVGLEVFFR